MRAVAQQPISLPGAKAGAEGRLTVAATVVSSIGLVVGSDGEQRMVVANAADPKDNVSRLQPVVTVKPATVADAAEKQKPKAKRKQ